MSAATEKPAEIESPGSGPSAGADRATKLGGAQRRQIAGITLGAVALYAVFRVLPTGTNLNHVDFRVSGANTLEMCDPSNPQFIPVVAMRSPVSMMIAAATPPRAGAETKGVVMLKTASGKSIGAADLLVVHTRKLHLLIVDPTLGDYQHVHPEPAEAGGGAEAGGWGFAFTPRAGGVYRIFADFTPAATARGLYASADLAVAEPGTATAGDRGAASETAETGLRVGSPGAAQRAVRDGMIFEVAPTSGPARAGKGLELAFTVARVDGAAVALEPVMGAWAHLVAFDDARSGFAHLHPNEVDPAWRPDPLRPRLTFKVTIPSAGRYAIWAQVCIGGRETFVPFWFEVGP